MGVETVDSCFTSTVSPVDVKYSLSFNKLALVFMNRTSRGRCKLLIMGFSEQAAIVISCRLEAI